MANKEMSKPVQVLRWLAVLPGAFLCVFLVTFPIHWAVMLIQILGRSDNDAFISINGKTLLAAIPPEMLERFGYAFFAPLVMIIVGTIIAPKFKFQTSIALAVFWGIIFGAGMIVFISQGSGWGWLRLVVTCLFGIGGVGLGLFLAHKSQKEKVPSNR